MLLSVLLPDQGKRHVPALQILVDRRPVRLRTLGLRRRSAGRRIQPALQLLLAQTLPTLQQACPLHPRDVVRHARPPDSKRLTDLPLAQTAHQQQTQHLLNLPHTESPCRHLSPFGAQNVTASEPFSPLVPTASRPPFRRSSKSGRLHVGTVAAFVSEWWPPSRRNGWPDSLGIPTLWQWAKRRHPTKGKGWVRAKYYRKDPNQESIFTAPRKSPDGSWGHLDLYRTSSMPIRRHA